MSGKLASLEKIAHPEAGAGCGSFALSHRLALRACAKEGVERHLPQGWRIPLKRLVSTAFAFGLWLTADGAVACTRILPPPRPGETEEKLFTRVAASEQLSDWRNSSVVYVARVTSAERHKYGGLSVGFEPVRSIKGGKPPRMATWHDPSVAMCGTGRRWAPGETVVVFVRQVSWRDSIRRKGQWFVYGAYPIGSIVEPTVSQALGGSPP